MSGKLEAVPGEEAPAEADSAAAAPTAQHSTKASAMYEAAEPTGAVQERGILAVKVPERLDGKRAVLAQRLGSAMGLWSAGHASETIGE